MNIFKNPSWIEDLLAQTPSLEKVPDSIFEKINEGLAAIQREPALVSVVIPAYNEEVSILRTLYSISRNKTSFPVEVIVVNNNSTDRTQHVLDKLNVKSYLQAKQGCGPARQLGQEMATGKYVLMADADCFYPPSWIEKMTNALLTEGVSCVYGGYSFLGTAEKPRWQLFIYESLRNVVAEIRQVKRPCLNALGMSMGYVREYGLKNGFVERKIRGEDGRMCFQLMKFGKIKRVRSGVANVWTLPRTLDKEGNLVYSILARVALEISRFKDYFYKQPDHDPHVSQNYEPKSLKFFKRYKNVHKQKEPVDGTGS